MIVYIGADHNGFILKHKLVEYLGKAGYNVQDETSENLDPQDDYPLAAQKVVNKILTSNDEQPMGILLCGSGQGMCMAANRFKGIRACLGYDCESVRSARNDDDANILCLPARHLEKDDANVLVETFLNTAFSHVGKYQRRIREIDNF
jgi:ribose 5-phosphate isomerase B